MNEGRKERSKGMSINEEENKANTRRNEQMKEGRKDRMNE
jgi:hypothetical protein